MVAESRVETASPRFAVLREQQVFLTLCALIMVNQLGFGLITPVLPLYADSFGLGPSAIGLVIGIYGAARFLANVPAGRVAEAKGRRPVLIAGALINAVSAALMASAQSLPQLLLYRLLGGLGAATVLVAGRSWWRTSPRRSTGGGSPVRIRASSWWAWDWGRCRAASSPTTSGCACPSSSS